MSMGEYGVPAPRFLVSGASHINQTFPKKRGARTPAAILQVADLPLSGVLLLASPCLGFGIVGGPNALEWMEIMLRSVTL